MPSSSGSSGRRRLAVVVAALAVLAGAGGVYAIERAQPDPASVAVQEPSVAAQAPDGTAPAAPVPSAPSAPVATTGASGAARPGAIVTSSTMPLASTRAGGARAPGGFPGAGNTGVPDGTRLADYTGPCTITKNKAVIEGMLVRCDPFTVKAREVTIRRSKVLGSLVTTEATAYSFTLEDAEVDAGVYQGPAVGSTNMTIRRADIHGGQTAVLCYANCDIRDSWLHGQRLPDGADWHLGGVLANDTGPGGRTDMVLEHNTIVCDSPSNSASGGCSGNVNLFADFGPVSNVQVRNNYLGANGDISYCVYGGSTADKQHTDGVRDIVFTGNVFQRGGNRKCGGYGPVTSFDASRPGNRWEKNVWDDGTPVQPAN